VKLGIDISQIVYEGTGVARFTNGLVGAILQYDKENEWIFFFSGLRKHLDPYLENRIRKKGFKIIKWHIPPTVLSFFWNEGHNFPFFHLPFSTSNSLDWFVTSDWTEPYLQVKKATIVHDLVYLRYPKTLPPIIKNTQKKRLRWIKKESQIIFSDSFSTKEDLIKLVGIDENKIKVIYPGLQRKLVKKTSQKKSFILTVGKIEPRKNLKRLIEAFQNLRNSDVELWIVGLPGWENLKINTPNVRFLGYVSEKKLLELYRTCLFFIYPSLWEGFGYPVVEAMAQGAPVATSNTSSLKEIGQDSALLFDPQDTKDIQRALEKLIDDQKLRETLGKKGQKKSKLYTWKNYYDEMIRSFKSF